MKRNKTLQALTACCCAWFILIAPAGAQQRDGRHDFDFNFGTWHTHIRRLLHPLANSNAWVEYDGTVTVRKVWDGLANLEEIEADGPGHIELMGLRMYNPATGQWSINGASSRTGILEHPLFGSFVDGSGIFYAQEPFDGRSILVRQTFTNISGNGYAFEQAFSSDGGASWEPNFVATLTRESSSAPSEAKSIVPEASHDFDFNYATWSTHIKYRTRSAAGVVKWGTLDGTVAVRKIWGGRALMEEIDAKGTQHLQGLTLFLYNPHAHQWSQSYASSSDGAFRSTMVGGFRDGRGDLVTQALYDGKFLFLRDVWSNITPRGHHFELQYSADGGRTWQPAFVANLARIGPGL